jgi:hypothetical protein
MGLDIVDDHVRRSVPDAVSTCDSDLGATHNERPSGTLHRDRWGHPHCCFASAKIAPVKSARAIHTFLTDLPEAIDKGRLDWSGRERKRGIKPADVD